MNEYTIKEIQTLFDSNELNSFDLTRQFIDRIKEFDKKTNSIIEINPDALEIARQLDKERLEKGKRSFLHGIPVIIKDNIETADKMMTTAGSLALEGNYAQNDAFIVKKLREAGAIILAKANLSEWANFRGERSISGWSSRGGQTRNPYALDRNPGGSSSGSGVAVASNFCVVAIGTETDGSVISPSSNNGIVGLKPTIGLVSRNGIIPISHTQDTAGSMGRTVEDVAILLSFLAGNDPDDEATSIAKAENHDYTKYLQVEGLKGSRLGLNKKHLSLVPKITKLFQETIKRLKDLGAEIIEFDDFPSVEKLDTSEMTVLIYDYYVDLNKYLSRVKPEIRIHSIAELVKFNEENKDKVLPYFGQEYLVSASEKTDTEPEEYIKAKKVYAEYKEKIKNFMNEYNLDALITPSNGPSWLIDKVNGDVFTGIGGLSSIAAITGLCNITVPMGYIQGLPIGLNFIGKSFDEETILKLAYSFEQQNKIRISPRFLDTLE